tara:strand:- start:27 stop:404 length:378 start_codon:yes stop_codon:yes gene_type:complete
MSNIKGIIKKAIKHGFDLSGIPEYSPKKFKSGLYDHLVENHYIVFEELGVLYIGYDIFQEVAEVDISGTTMKVKPLMDTGFFEILIELFRYVGIAAEQEKSPQQKNSDEKTTEDCDSGDSEEIWL